MRYSGGVSIVGSLSTSRIATFNSSPFSGFRFAVSTRDISLVNEKTVRDFNSATCPCGVHASVSSFSMIGSGSVSIAGRPTAWLKKRYIASRFSTE